MKHTITLFAVLMMALAIPQSVKAYDFSAVAPSGQTLYYLISGNAVEVTYGEIKPTGVLVIPDSVTYMGVSFAVKTIGSQAFRSCVGLTSVTIGGEVTSIGYDAFQYCTNMTSLTLSNSVTEIGFESFEGCTALPTVTIPNSVTIIGIAAFRYCSGLTSIIIPNSVTNIDSWAFDGCSNLTSIYFGNSINYISGTNSFSGCNNIIYLQYDCNSNPPIPNVIPHNSLQTVVIGNNVTSIPENAFTNTSTLTHVTIGSGVTFIGENAFRFCTNLDTIFALPATAPSLGANVFQGTPNDKVVVTNCNADYASVWGSTGFNYTTGGFTLTLASNNESWGTASFVQGVDCQQTAIIQAIATAGHRFVAWSDGNTSNPRTISLSQNTTLTAYFEEHNVLVTAISANELMGSVNGGGIYPADSEVSVSAIAACNYRFVHWQDGDASNPRTIVLTNDITLIAYFELNSDTVTIHDTTYVDVPFAVHDTVILIEYVPVHDTTYIDIYDTTYVDVFVHDTTVLTQVDTVTLTEYVSVHDTTYINVHDTTYVDVPYPVHDTTVVTDTVALTVYVPVYDTTYIDVHDTTYVPVHDTTYIDVPYAVHDTTIVTDTLTEYVGIHDTTIINVPYAVHDTTYIDVPYAVHDTTYIDMHDTTFVDVPYPVHDTTIITLTDTVTNTVYDTVDNYIYDTTFLYDTTLVTDTLWVYDTIYIHDTIYVSQEGVGEVEAADIKLYQRDGCIVVEGDVTGNVRVYDAVGRLLHATGTHSPVRYASTPSSLERVLRIPVPTTGVYLVKIGALPARRVVVVR